MKIEFEGNLYLADERFNIIICNLKPLADCRIDLCLKYSWHERPYKSFAIFNVNEAGEVNLGKQKPIKGSYKTIDSMGLFYGLKGDRGTYSKRKKRDFTKEFIACEFTFRCDSEHEKRFIQRYFISENIRCKSIYESFRGEYYYHADKGDKKSIILLGGSEGVINPLLPIAASLANKGFNVLAVQYFNPFQDNVNEENVILPKKIECIPVEYINNAVDWLIKKNPFNEVSMIGSSKGAELALLVASVNKNIKQLVAISPSAYVFEGVNSLQSSWSLKSYPVPFIPYLPFINILDLIKNYIFSILQIPQGYILSYELSRLLCFDKKKARIKVENINGDVCIMAGGKIRCGTVLVR